MGVGPGGGTGGARVDYGSCHPKLIVMHVSMLI